MNRKSTCLTFWLAIVSPVLALAQVIWTEPYFPRLNSPVTVYFDASKGTGGLKNCNCTVYLHTGVITNQSTSTSDWKNVVTTWGVANSAWAMTPVAGQPNVYKYEIKPTIKDYYKVAAGITVQKLAFVFRNATGTQEGKDAGGKDIFYDVFNGTGLASTLLSPAPGSNFVLNPGNSIAVKGVASESADLQLLDNGQIIAQATGTQLEHTLTATTSGAHKVDFVATTASEKTTTSFSYVVFATKPQVDPPAGTQPGYRMIGDTLLRVALHAPGKTAIFVIGDFNDWTLSSDYQLTRSLDGTLHWMDIGGLRSGQTIRFQYVDEKGKRFGDPYSELVLDPDNDRFIPSVTFPGLPAYPTGKTTGIVSVIRPENKNYAWKVNNFQKPQKEGLVVYELLLRDFLARHDYLTLIDSLNYLQRLGVNAIELMPVQEFEGNLSWGYNPSYHMALDKYYGTPEQFKAFVDACHARGIAVILDVVFNHAFSQSPLAQLYWDDAAFRPSADNPWLNQAAPHNFSVGYDFNHESAATKFFVKKVLRFWMEEYRMDGFRFDLSKGFTQKNTLGNANAMAQYDASRVAILKDYANAIWSVDPNAYVILEHFADNSEETELTRNGMLVWGNMNGAFNEATMGYTNDLSWLDYRRRGWNGPGAVYYMESHDEERLMFKNLTYGNSSGLYSVKDFGTALKRQELATVFLFSVPGPRMIWQFGEVGYDHSLFTCGDGQVKLGDDGCKLSNKPIRWDFLNNPSRTKLFEVTRAMLHLRKTYPVFQTTNFTADLSASGPKRVVLQHPDLNVVVLGNFNVTPINMQAIFPNTGAWYDYFKGDSIQINATTVDITLQPGEYRLLTSKPLAQPPAFVTSVREQLQAVYRLEAFPNPTGGPFQIRYQLPEPTNVQVDLYDATGRKLKTLLRERQPAGEQMLNWEESLTPGPYWVRLQVKNGTLSRMVLVH